VAVSGDKEIERRKLLSNYRREQKMRTQGINRLHVLFVHVEITMVVKMDLSTDEGRLEIIEQLRRLKREEAEHLVGCLVLHEARIKVLDGEMGERMNGDE
jgi:hypothetical protein